MSRLLVTRCCVVLTTAILLVGGGIATSYSDDDATPLSPKQRIRAALKQKVRCDFVETPLAEVVDFLIATTKINIHLDTKALDEVGIGSDVPVTITLPKISLAAALRNILRPLELTYNVEHEVLMITTGERADESLHTVVYDVADFAEPPHVPEIRHVGRASMLKPSDRLTSLIEVISRTVEPISWDEVGGPGSIDEHDDTLIVTQTTRVHEQIPQVISALRAVRDRPAAQHDPVRIGDPIGMSARETIRKTLSTETPALDFVDTPLDDVVAFLQEETKVPVIVDLKALDEVGVGADTPVTLRAKNISLRSALRLMLRTIDPSLTYFITDEVLLITTAECAEENLIVFLYPMTDLIGGNERTGKGPYPQAFDAISEAIVGTVERDSWDEAGGPGSIDVFPKSHCLIIAQTQSVHDDIAEFLRQLRAVRAKRIPSQPAEQLAAATNNIASSIVVYHLRKPQPARDDDAQRGATPPTDDEHAAPAAEAERIASLVKELIEPSSWQAEAAAMYAVDGKLVIRQREPTHHQIHGLLESLELLESSHAQHSGFGF